ncbi:non-specific serine/threonine protein kinase [Ranunculus cassubicifolius]
MGFFSCSTESSIIACDPYNWESNKRAANKKRKKKKKRSSYKIRRFLYNDLETATNGFSPECFLGKGSHGSVYKAVLDNGKLTVAVKRSILKKCSNSTVPVPGENEIEILTKIQNPRFVNLLGYSFDLNHNKLIVVEYMENGSLFDLLHTNPRPPNWAKRVRFALQIARAVETLHSSSPSVIHRDIKSSNVLIDGDWNARLGDFGLALRGRVEDGRMKCTPPAGTLGYLDPSYIAPENLSAKNDVFSFGILLLEIISGRNAIDVNYSPPFVVEWALPLIKHGEFVGLCDPRIDLPDDLSIVQQLSMLAVRCVRDMAEKRPSMAEVVECLRIVNKTVSFPMWHSFRRQMSKQEMVGCGEEAVKTSKPSNRISSIRNRKVCSLSMDFGKENFGEVGIRIGRSNSVGSIRELVGHQIARNRRRSVVAVKLHAVKLSKSRSLSMLQSSSLAHDQEGSFVLKMSELVISVKETQQSEGNSAFSELTV